MAFQAVENVAVAFVRGRVPEFEATFRELLEEEGYWELSAIATFNELARWVLEQSDADVQARTFGAVEFVFTEDSMREGNDEAVEFFESVAAGLRDEPGKAEAVRSAWGEAAAQWFTRWGPQFGFSPRD